MEVRLLGSLEVGGEDGQPIGVAGGRQRTLLALLALRPGAVVPAERLIDDLWGERAPQQPGNALQVAVFKLRRTVGADVIATRPPGYSLAVVPEDVDAVRFERLVQDGRAALEEGRAGTAVGCFDEALGLWRGDALVEFGDVPTVMAAASRLEELRAATREDRFDALLAMGRDADLVPDLDSAIAAAPFRERLRGQLMLALYRSGRQADALRVFGDARRVLADELGLDPGPELCRLEAAILAQDPSLELAPRSRVVVRETETGSGAPTNLRPSLTSFVGRQRDVAGVSKLLATNRLVTLVGAGGSGKTRLACEVAAGRSASFPDGVWFVALDSTTTGDGVAATVAGALGLSMSDAAGQPEMATVSSVDRIRGALADRRTMVVLDNCEHVIDAAAQLAVELLSSAPGVRLLATSREALRVPGEMVWTVPPLDTDDAMTLFTERARAAAADFVLNESDRGVLADLCARLDGMPLAIELTAARCNAFTVTQLAERLDDRFRLLTGGARTALPRQQTLRAVTDWSYDLLFAHERTVFERLSVFAGGCTLEAAEAVCSDEQLRPADIGDIVGRLVDKSLLVNDGAGRYRLLLTLAQYGRERLANQPDGLTVRDHHAAYYRRLAELSFVDWRAPQGRNLVWWMGHLTEELDNLRAALEWSIACDDGATAQALAGYTGWFWWHAGRTAEGLRWLERALACAGPTTPEVRAPAATWAAAVALEAGHIDIAGQHVAQAIELNDVYGDGALQGMAGVVAARLALLDGAVDIAIAHLERAQQAHQRLGGPWGEGIAAAVRAFAATLRGELDTAERENLFSIDRLRTVGDVASLVLTLDQHSRLLLSTGRSAEAESIVREARDVSASHGMRGWESTMSTRLGSLALARGDLDAAGEQFQVAAALARDLAFPAAEAPAIDGLGLVHRHRGELAEAARCHQAARALAARCDTMANVVLSTAHLGHVAEAAGELDEARRLYGEVFAMARRFEDDRAAALALEGLAGVIAAAGDGELAAMLLGYATHLRVSIGDTMQGDERFDVERAERSARALLGDDEFQRAHEAGRCHDDVEALFARIELTTAS